MKFLLWFILITFGLSILIRLAGPFIARWMMRKLVKKAEQDMKAQSEFYNRKVADSSPFESNVYIREDVKVSIPRGREETQKRKKQSGKNDIESVDYEEV